MHQRKLFFLTSFTLAFFLFCALFATAQSTQPANEKKGIALNEKEQRKFDYYFYEGINAKVQGKYDEAFDYLQHCYSIDSTNANVLTELGTFYNVLDEKSKALVFLKKAVKYDPKNYYYNTMLAGLSKESGNNQEAIAIYQFLLKEYPSKLELYMQLSQAYADSGELQKAVEVLNELEKISGVSETTALNKFQLYSMLNQKEKAFTEIENIIAQNPDDPRYIVLIGDLYLQDNQPDKAIYYYNQAKAIDPDYPNLIHSMVNYYEKTGNEEAAEEELRKAIMGTEIDVDTKVQLLTRYIDILRQNKRDMQLVNSLFETLFDQYPRNTLLNLIYGNVLLLQENKEEAMKQFEIYTKANPTDPAGYEQMLRIVLPDSIDKVIEITTEAIKHIPEAPQFYFYLGGAKYQQKKYKEALEVFEEGLKSAKIENPMLKSDFYGQIGDLNYFLGNKEAAFKNYEKALKLNPRNLPVLNNYSYYLSLEGKDLDKAEQMSSITVKAEPTNPTYLDTYGWVLFKQGAYTTAKIYIENAVKYSKEEPSAEIFEHYGDVLYMTGEPEKAVEQWKKAKELGSDSKTLDEKIRTGKYIEAK
ncbi:tetratricopeptide repeat protein [Anaerorudis cellulosivorans]|uniref:tetratricopeptide repeat protein n=1 Tax=Anaerorudis cellulosivorans TaxID=3397862 RepID=UPI00221F2F4A|nr:tetratricopeptide repeat protein [Seramator thermalis]MCW1735945.1 tetratricopeptide repeat protein [Seramator thermalis]